MPRLTSENAGCRDLAWARYADRGDPTPSGDHADKAREYGRAAAEKELIPAVSVAIQAAIGQKIIAREQSSAPGGAGASPGAAEGASPGTSSRKRLAVLQAATSEQTLDKAPSAQHPGAS